MDNLFDYIPTLSEYDFIVRLFELIKLTALIIKLLFFGKAALYTGKLYSPEHKQSFEAENIKITIAKSAKDNKPLLALEDMRHTD